MSGPSSPLPPGRLAPLRDPVTMTLDDEPFVAERGEPIAAALVAAGKITLARSPKFHRPRGPTCFRAACDGCLARVDETPNVMTCMAAAKDGTQIVSQNRLGSRETDLLRMADWFFPEGMNHHELFAGVPGMQSVLQVFARRVAGLGRLPASSEPGRSAARRRADVVVVGGGPSGMAIGTRLTRAGRTVEILDDQLAPGGGMTALGPTEARAFRDIHASCMKQVSLGMLRLRSETTGAAIYDSASRSDLLVVGPEGAEVIEANALVLACGAHDGGLPFEGNDVPGVMSARAAGWLLNRGVVVGKRVVVIDSEGVAGPKPPFGASFAQAFADAVRAWPEKARPSVTLVHGEPVRVLGATRAKAVVVSDAAGKETEHPADAVVIDTPPSPAYELAEQAGAALVREARGYVVQTEDGRIAPGVYAVGELTGTPFDARAIADEAARVGRTILDAR